MNLYPMCRLCQHHNETTFNMFSAKMSDVSYSDVFIFVTNLNVSEDDGLPSELCCECANRLKCAYQLKRQAVQTDHLLRKQLHVQMEDLQNQNKSSLSIKSLDQLTENEEYDMLDSQTDDTEKVDSISNVEFNNVILKKTNQHVDKWVQEQNREIHSPQPPTEEDEQEKDCPFVDVEELDMHLVYEDSDEDANQYQEDGVQFLKSAMVKNLSKITQSAVTTSDIKKRKRRRCTTVHKCQVCERIFARKSNLIDHLRLHAKVKLFQCSYCDKSFVQVANYRTHMRTHTKERPFKCTMCSKAYTQTSALKIHIRSHTQERNYVCRQCEKGFTNASDLSKHGSIHDSYKQFQCNVCQRQFAQKVNMLNHQRRMHGAADNKIAMKRL